MGMAASTPTGALQALTHFFNRLQPRSFGLDVRLFLTGDTDFTAWDDAERTGGSLLLMFSTAGSRERWRYG